MEKEIDDNVKNIKNQIHRGCVANKVSAILVEDKKENKKG